MKRYLYIEWLRVLSALAVVAIHVLTHYLGGFPLKSDRWVVTMILKHMTHFCIPTFFMISGALLLQPNDFSYGQFIKKRFTRILYPFLIWSFVHYIVILVSLNGASFSFVTFFNLSISNGVSSQYWYVYATLILYLLLPFMGKLIASLSREELKILIGIMVLINLILPFVKQLLNTFTDWTITTYNMASLGAYVTYAIIGYYLHTMEIPSNKTRFIVAVGGVLSFALICLLCWKVSVNKYDNTFGENKYPLACIMSVALFIVVRGICETRNTENPKIISLLSTNSYTAYLTHMMYLRLIQAVLTTKYVVSLSKPLSGMAMLGEFVSACIACFGTAFLAHRIPKISKYL